MTARARWGLDLAAVLRASDRGAEPVEVPFDAPGTEQPVAAAEAVRTVLAQRGELDRRGRRFAIAADLITGRLVRASAQIAALPVDEQAALARFLVPVWGVGHAPSPPAFAAGLEALKLEPDGAQDGIRYFQEVMRHRWQAWRVIDADRLHRGSAAVVNGAWFSDDLVNRSLVLTCAHVCSTFPTVPGRWQPTPPAAVMLDWLGDDPEDHLGPLRVKGLVWESHPDELDAALLEVEELPLEARAPAEVPTAEPTQSERIYLWGYRQDQAISLSIEDNQIRRVAQRYFYYAAFAERGVSGSPVFDKHTHQLVGLHRGEDNATESRGAVFFQQVLRAARAALRHKPQA